MKIVTKLNVSTLCATLIDWVSTEEKSKKFYSKDAIIEFLVEKDCIEIVEEKPAELPGTTRFDHNSVLNNVAMAEKMLATGEITTPEEYFNVLKKGNKE